MQPVLQGECETWLVFPLFKQRRLNSVLTNPLQAPLHMPSSGLLANRAAKAPLSWYTPLNSPASLCGLKKCLFWLAGVLAHKKKYTVTCPSALQSSHCRGYAPLFARNLLLVPLQRGRKHGSHSSVLLQVSVSSGAGGAKSCSTCVICSISHAACVAVGL